MNLAMVGYLTFLGVQGLSSLTEPASLEPVEGTGLAMFGHGAGQSRPVESARIPVAVPDGLLELKQTYQILGIICRDAKDRSVFVKDLATGEERIYRVGDSLNGTNITEIHPSYVVLGQGGSRLILDLFARERDRLADPQGEEE